MGSQEGDLSTHIKKCKEKGQHFPEELILNWFSQIMLALKYIHRLNILHRDLKTSNILLQENGDLKIGDFGIARVLEGTMQNAESVVGTPYYMSPEICQNQPYSFKSDVWSLGCVLYELCTLEHAFRSNNLLNLVYKIVHEEPEPIPAEYSPELSSLISLMLRKRLEDRPTLDQVIQVDFVRWFLIGFMNTDKEAEEALFLPRGTKSSTLSEREALQKNNESSKLWEKRRLYSDSAHTPVHEERNGGRVSAFDYTGANSQQSLTAYNSSQKFSELTPMQKLKLRKEAEVKRREEEMKRAIRQETSVHCYVDKMAASKLGGKDFSRLNASKQATHSTKQIDSNKSEDLATKLDKLPTGNRSALKVGAMNVISNFDSELAKSIKVIGGSEGKASPAVVNLEFNSGLKNRSEFNASRASYNNTIRQNLEETIQSQYVADVRPAFTKQRGNAPPSFYSEEKEDFPPDFEEVADEFANQRQQCTAEHRQRLPCARPEVESRKRPQIEPQNAAIPTEDHRQDRRAAFHANL